MGYDPNLICAITMQPKIDSKCHIWLVQLWWLEAHFINSDYLIQHPD